MLPLGFVTNVINSTTLSVLTPGIRILYFCVFYRWKWLEEESKRSKFNVMIIVIKIVVHAY